MKTHILHHNRIIYTGTLAECISELCASYRSVKQNPTVWDVLRSGIEIKTIH